MQSEQDIYRCRVSDASGRALLKIRDILADDTLDDPGVDCGGRHDFG